MADLKGMLVESGAILFGEFTLTSGKKSPFYVDIKKASCDPGVLRAIGEAIAPDARRHDALAGMELGAVPIAVAASLASGKPFAIVRKGDRAHGTGKQVEGSEVKGKRVLVVEDVTTTGGSVVKTVERLREAGAYVSEVVTVVDREEGATEALRALNVALHPLVRVGELLRERKA